MVTEIREYGDKTTIVVFTDDNIVLRKLREWKSCQKIVFYEVWKDCDSKKTVNVSVDLYFNKKVEDRIREALNMPIRGKQRSKAQHQQTKILTKVGKQFKFSSRSIKDAEKVGVFVVKN